VSSSNGIPIYSADNRSLGFRTLEAAHRLLAADSVNGVYGPRKKLKAIFLKQADGANPVTTQPPTGTHYSYQKSLDSGRRCWNLKRLDVKDDDGTVVSMRGAYEQVVRECMR
jgi:hypothetical protein